MEAQYVKSSWYGLESGTTRADGHPYDRMALTVAHKTLPFGTKLLLYNPDNGKQVVVYVRDRGPYIRGRELDCSEGTAIKLGFRNKGVTRLLVIRLNYIENTKHQSARRLLPRTLSSQSAISRDASCISKNIQRIKPGETNYAMQGLSSAPFSRTKTRDYSDVQVQDEQRRLRRSLCKAGWPVCDLP